MISKLISNILAANDKHRGICQSSHIRIELYHVEDFFKANNIPFDNDPHIIEMLKSSLGDNWYISLLDDGSVELLEIPDNWVKVHINADGKVENAYYV